MPYLRRLFLLLTLFSAFAAPAFSMHIMEGYLPTKWCVVWYLLALPFVVYSFLVIRRIVRCNPAARIRMALSGAFIFILTALKLPSVTGSCSHLTGAPFGAVYARPAAIPLLSTVVLIFQALLLAHGGITTLGANIFSLGVCGPIVTWGLYLSGKKLRLPEQVSIFIAAFFGSLSTYLCTSLQLALAYPGNAGIFGSALKFMGIFMITQLPLSVIEGLLTVFVIRVLKKQDIQLNRVQA